MPASAGYFRTQIKYNNKGDKIEVNYFDTEGQLIDASSDGAATVNFLYDDLRNIRKTLKRDKYREIIAE